MTSSTRSSSWTMSRRKLGTTAWSSSPESSTANPRAWRIRTISSWGGQAPMTRSMRARPGARIHVDHTLGDRAPAEISHELSGAIEGLAQPLDVRAALEAIGGVGVEPQRARGPADGAGIEVGGLEEDRGRRLRHFGGAPAHDAAHGDGPLGVTDHEHVGGKGAVLAVERAEPLAGAGAPDHNPVLGD